MKGYKPSRHSRKRRAGVIKGELLDTLTKFRAENIIYALKPL